MGVVHSISREEWWRRGCLVWVATDVARYRTNSNLTQFVVPQWLRDVLILTFSDDSERIMKKQGYCLDVSLTSGQLPGPALTERASGRRHQPLQGLLRGGPLLFFGQTQIPTARPMRAPRGAPTSCSVHLLMHRYDADPGDGCSGGRWGPVRDRARGGQGSELAPHGPRRGDPPRDRDGAPGVVARSRSPCLPASCSATQLATRWTLTTNRRGSARSAVPPSSRCSSRFTTSGTRSPRHSWPLACPSMRRPGGCSPCDLVLS